MDTNSFTELNTVKTKPLLKEALSWLNICGISPYNQSPWSKIRATIGFLGLMYLDIEVLLQFFMNWKGWESVDGFIVFTSLVQMTYKMAFMFLKKWHFLILLHHMERFWSWDDLDCALLNAFNNMAVVATKAVKIVLIAALITLLLYLLRPLLGNDRTLPMDTYNPTDRKSNYYIFMYMLQTVQPAFGCLYAVAFDTLFVSFVIHIICQIRIMKHRFLTVNINLSSNVDDQSTLDEFNNLIRHHCLILTCIKIINEIYSDVLLGQFASSVACICSGLLNMVQLGFPPDLQHFVTYSVFISTILFQLFIYCLVGTFMMEESLSLSEAVYGWDWWAKPQPQLRKASILLIQRAQKIETLKAGAIFPLNLESFTMIVRFFFRFLPSLRECIQKLHRSKETLIWTLNLITTYLGYCALFIFVMNLVAYNKCKFSSK